MTVDAIRRKPKRSRAASAAIEAGPASFAIGEADANIFDCPSCRRPLSAGTSGALDARHAWSRACVPRARPCSSARASCSDR